MTVRGHIRNGRITLDDPAPLPEGAKVVIEVVDAADERRSGQNGEDVSALLLRHAGKGRDLPADLAARHDHYAHGKPNP